MMKLTDALLGVRRLGFDTPPFIYFVERHPNHLALMREVFRAIDAGTVSGHSSVITLTEVLTLPLRLNNDLLANEYRDLLLNGRNLSLQPIDASIAERAADLRARYGLRTPDALQLATAIDAGCEAFLTNDTGLRRVTELRVLVLDDLEL